MANILATSEVFLIQTFWVPQMVRMGTDSCSHCHPMILPHNATTCLSLLFPLGCCWKISRVRWLEVIFWFPDMSLLTVILYFFFFFFFYQFVSNASSSFRYFPETFYPGEWVCILDVCTWAKKAISLELFWQGWWVYAQLELSLLLIKSMKSWD